MHCRVLNGGGVGVERHCCMYDSIKSIGCSSYLGRSSWLISRSISWFMESILLIIYLYALQYGRLSYILCKTSCFCLCSCLILENKSSKLSLYIWYLLMISLYRATVGITRLLANHCISETAALNMEIAVDWIICV